jgi:hypothetical protein
MPLFTVEEENLLAILPEGLDKDQIIFELERMFHLEEGEEMKVLIHQCKMNLEGIEDIALENSYFTLAENLE